MVTWLTNLCETHATKFTKSAEFFRLLLKYRRCSGRENSRALGVQIIQRGNGRRGWFCRRSVVLVFAGFRTWRFVELGPKGQRTHTCFQTLSTRIHQANALEAVHAASRALFHSNSRARLANWPVFPGEKSDL